jgi:hypothetical protein
MKPDFEEKIKLTYLFVRHDLLLAACRIVTMFYRQVAMSDEEMSQRKKLVGTLKQLTDLRNLASDGRSG